ncbi:MAG: hypothetical protein AB1Z23_01850 [Eubacteriales bacterium]
MSSKREHFKDIITNIASQNIEYVEQVFIDDMIEMLNESEVYILGVLYKCMDTGEFEKRIADAKGTMSSSNSFFIDQNFNRMLEIISGWEIDNVYSVVESLQKKGLLEKYAVDEDLKGVELLNNSLTKDGRTICEAIMA